MKRLFGLVALLVATGAFAQTAPPKAAKKQPLQIKPQAPIGCKPVGTVRGTKIWAGDCAAPSDLRGAPAAAPAAPTEQ
jgi:hypothetical protein